MSIKFTKLGTILLITGVITLFSGKLLAQTATTESDSEEVSVVELFEKAYFNHTGNAYQNDSIWGQINSIVGFTLYPEKQISLDGKLVDLVYRDIMKQQAKGSTLMQTQDLISPYTTSLQENPDYIGY